MRLPFLVLCAALAVPASAQAPTPSFIIPSPDTLTFEGFGAFVDAVGDVDGDGGADLVVAAPLSGGLNYGKVYLVTSTGVVEGEVTSPNPRRNGLFGSAAAFVGDLTGDFRREALVGAPGETAAVSNPFMEGGDGRAYVLEGGSGDVLFSFVSPNADTLDTFNDGQFGSSVAGPGDLTGDGVPDFVVGARYETTTETSAGRVYVFSGADGSLVRTLESPSPAPTGSFGAAIEPVSDLDGDGVTDLLIAADRERPPDTMFMLGRVHVISGATGDLIHTLDSGLENSLPTMSGDLVDVGDLDGDGLADIAVGGPNQGADGVVYLFSGATGDLIRIIDPMLPEDGSLAQFGQSIVPVGDLNGDGTTDLFVGAPFDNDPDSGVGRAGRAFLVSGATGEILNAFASTSPRLNGRFGLSVDWADVDGDGENDPVVGAPFEREIPERANGGLVYLYTQEQLRSLVVTASESAEPLAGLALGTPRPNPLQRTARLPFSLDAPAHVRLTLHDLLGREVAVLAHGARAAGPHAIQLDALSLSAGVYVARLIADGRVATRRIVVAR